QDEPRPAEGRPRAVVRSEVPGPERNDRLAGNAGGHEERERLAEQLRLLVLRVAREVVGSRPLAPAQPERPRLHGVRVELHVVPAVEERPAGLGKGVHAEVSRAEGLDEERTRKAVALELVADEADPELLRLVRETAEDAKVVAGGGQETPSRPPLLAALHVDGEVDTCGAARRGVGL